MVVQYCIIDYDLASSFRRSFYTKTLDSRFHWNNARLLVAQTLLDPHLLESVGVCSPSGCYSQLCGAAGGVSLFVVAVVAPVVVVAALVEHVVVVVSLSSSFHPECQTLLILLLSLLILSQYDWFHKYLL